MFAPHREPGNGQSPDDVRHADGRHVGVAVSKLDTAMPARAGPRQ
nr:hypothetical protein [uncultured Halomonas sp.]